jgi:citrate synthase
MLININVDALNHPSHCNHSPRVGTGRGSVMAEQESGLRADEVAQLLGVKRQTVYAYVSRGILHRRMAIDGRTSLFDRAEVEALRLGKRPESDGQLRTVLASGITRVSDDGLLLRGHQLVDLVAQGAGYTDIADLLWQTPGEERWPTMPAAPVRRERLGIEGLALIDQLRVIVAQESSGDPLRYDLSPKSIRAAGRRAIIAMATGVWGHQTTDPISSHQAEESGTATDGVNLLGEVLWGRLTAMPGGVERHRCLDVALALMADHGLATSTFGARVAASVRADPYSVISAGLGVFGGPLHGAASRAVHDLLTAADETGDVAAIVGDAQTRGSLPGFGHAVYRRQDPRYGALMGHLVEAWADDDRLRIVFRVRDVVGERSDSMPNIDLAIGALTFLSGMSARAGEAISAISRTAGWLAHAIEEYDEKPLRFRTEGSYIGPLDADGGQQKL